MAAVYRLVNRTKREIYYGTSADPEQRVKEHAAGGTDALEGWDFENDDVVWRVEVSDTTDDKATSIAHALEASGPPDDLPGYTVIQTGGK